jgi:hypothetical protein
VKRSLIASLTAQLDAFEVRFLSILGPEIEKRRQVQDAEHGGPAHDDIHTPFEWVGFIDRFARLSERRWLTGDRIGYESALIDVAALAVSAILSSRRVRSEEP